MNNGEEFYVPRSLIFHSGTQLLYVIMGLMYYYNNVREHSSLKHQTSTQVLKQRFPEFDDSIPYVIPVMFDKTSVEIGPWIGYNI